MVKNKIKEIDGPSWSIFLDTADEEEGGRFLGSAPLAVGTGTVE